MEADTIPASDRVVTRSDNEPTLADVKPRRRVALSPRPDTRSELARITDALRATVRSEQRERARKVLLFVSFLSVICKVPRNRIVEHRIGGAEGRSLRRIGIHYATQIGCTDNEQERLFDLNRKQVGQERAAISATINANVAVEETVASLMAMMDAALQADRDLMIRVGDRKLKTAQEIDRETDEELGLLLEDDKPKKQEPWNPAKQPKPVVRAETEQLVLDAQAARRATQRTRALAICEKIMEAGVGPKATKETKGYAAVARLVKAEINGAGKIARGAAEDATDEERKLGRKVKSAVHAIIGQLPS